MRTLARLTPNGWALDAFTSVSVDGATLTDVVPALGVLVAFGVAFGVVGLVLLGRRS
jgi:ABC-type multidrug transport system permease subunit